jgi:hypothetical protein
MGIKKWASYLEKLSNVFEFAIAFFLLVVVLIKIAEMIMGLAGYSVGILTMEFDRILSASLALVIGIEFTKMLYKHTPETVIDVLLFAIARHMVMYHERTLDMLVGVLAIAGLFAAKKYLIERKTG